ncbi:unnamed protein product [Xylocopa violacea]|uniref:RING-type domain-containing protein n=1 Tax=Xylocopa violacea TaxID=135666 RepID=A0ABP1N9P6_XYLVO
MPHAGLAALLLGVTVATVLYFMFGNRPEPQQYYETNHSYSQKQYYFTEYDCPICLSPLTRGSKCVLRNCKHKFHRDCIQRWKSEACGVQALCPICRSPIT